MLNPEMVWRQTKVEHGLQETRLQHKEGRKAEEKASILAYRP